MEMIIDPKSLNEEALVGLIESHITDGADLYRGDLAGDTERVRSMLAKAELLIVYSEEQLSARIMHRDDVPPELLA